MQRLESVEEKVKESKFLADLAEKRSNELEQYGRRNNVRVFGVPEPEKETIEQCESAVLGVFNEKMGLRVVAADIEAVHRLGATKKTTMSGQQVKRDRPRPIIVRFISRKAAEDVLFNRRKLKNTRLTITEDLTKSNFVLLNMCLDTPGVDDAWSKRGKIFVKTQADDRIRQITSLGDLHCLPPAPTSTPLNARERRKQKALNRLQTHNQSPIRPGHQDTNDPRTPNTSFRDALVRPRRNNSATDLKRAA
nr:hypothetical protein BaRGS_020954 [Batillaria attramentaria]